MSAAAAGDEGREGRSLDDWAALLRSNWQALAESRFRDYFVASHRGCDDPRFWLEQARFDASVVLHELAPETLRGMDVLELGCGVGRLAGVIAPLVRSYTGIDIAPAMLAEAQQRLAALGGTRLFLGDGARVPEAARDRRYALVFALAVFVHCPRELIGALVADAASLLAPGGELRFQLRADASDPSGIQPPEEAPPHAPRPEPPDAPHRPDEVEGMRAVSALLADRYYMGHAFRHAEVVPFLRGVVPGASVRLMRFDPHHLYVDLGLPRA